LESAEKVTVNPEYGKIEGLESFPDVGSKSNNILLIFSAFLGVKGSGIGILVGFSMSIAFLLFGEKVNRLP
jgi:hypothetical protein